MRSTTFQKLEEYVPSGHEGVLNRLLVGAENWGVDAVSIWHGTLTPESKSDLHIHPNSVQIYVGLSGVTVVGNGEREEKLEHLGTVMFAAGESHFIANRSNADAEVLVVSVPGLR